MSRTKLFISFILTCIVANAAEDNRTMIFNPSFKTLQTAVNGNTLLPAVISLNGGDALTVSFDELSTDDRYLRYRLSHRDASWNPSNITDTEFTDGFNVAGIDDISHSFGTTVNYVHYSLTLPNDEINIKASGNYLLEVYDEDEPETQLLQCRFMVTEQAVAISSDATSRTDVDFNDSHQQLSIEVAYPGDDTRDIYNETLLKVAQNGRWDNEVCIEHPSYVNGNKAVYQHLPQLIFDAGNEYRRMENVSTTFLPMHVREIDFRRPYYHFILEDDVERGDGLYEYDSTQNGRFVVREYNSANPDTEADYVVTLFSLDADEMKNADVYIEGDLTQRLADGVAKMEYNHATGKYERFMLLKQGAYNYQYLLKRRDDDMYTNDIEGNFFPTANEYLITVYGRRHGERYDRLLGVDMVKFK